VRLVTVMPSVQQYSSIPMMDGKNEPVPVESPPSSPSFSRRKKLFLVSLLVGAALIASIVISSRSLLSSPLPSTGAENGVNRNGESDSNSDSNSNSNSDSNSDSNSNSNSNSDGDNNSGYRIGVAASDSGCTSRGGTCKTSGCDGQWLTGLCAGAADRRCCVSGGGGVGCSSGGISQSSAQSQLSSAGIPTSSSGRCDSRSRTDCTSLECIRQSTVSGLINFKRSSNCPQVTITGGTEVGHAAGQYSHYNGYKVDIAMTPCLTSHIQSKFKKLDSIHWADGAGNNYHYEGNHWDITYY